MGNDNSKLPAERRGATHIPAKSPSGDPNVLNVIVFGHNGGGVSSVVNLIAGKEIAKVSSDTPRCTVEIGSYQIPVKDSSGKIHSINLYDIPGFNERAQEFVQFPSFAISLAIICTQDLRNQVLVTANYLKKTWGEHGDIPILIVIT
ncbi:hypothetical protein PAXINDRAFT_103788 [Paxillus involutus ATCC 200175]|uniref:G domain-containing protein n=1 Tax=Paxillus involutus ATCC 200175 TaxID=664439 RepID=A0A0C9TDU8_PAXIN|nr:hypothetical protein PAXINDRAFT_103788 [Paxillus involutus ATCC 200175]